MCIEEQIISEIKQIINDCSAQECSSLESIKNKWSEYQEVQWERNIAWDFIFQKIYLHASMKKQKDVCDWMNTLFNDFDPIIKIAMRQMFSYSKYLLNK